MIMLVIMTTMYNSLCSNHANGDNLGKKNNGNIMKQIVICG